jgi:glycosyltransferase involved in cell wall biosynthesis
LKLSIIIPVYNVENHISTCIQSICNQDINEKDYEILIIDDGSTDNSINIALHFERKYTNIHVYSQKNEGVGSARNKGISLAKGKYIYFIDPDDYLADNVLDLILFYAEKNNLQILTFSSQGTTKSNLNKSLSNNTETFKLQTMDGVSYISSEGYKNEVWWYIIERSFLNEIGLKFIVGRWMEDAIFTCNLLLKAKHISKLPIDAHRHVKVKGSAMTSKEPEHYIKVIYDNANAAKELGNLIQEVKASKNANSGCIKRLQARQQSFVFFLMIRILKSRITFKEVKYILNSMKEIKAYPLNDFIGKDYNGVVYKFITRFFNQKPIYYSFFLICNPIFKVVNTRKWHE